MKRTPNRLTRRSRRPGSESARKTERSVSPLPKQGHGSASPPTVPAVLAPQILPAITASLDLPVGPEGLIDSVSAKFERFVMEQIRSGEQVCATAKKLLANCEQQFQKAAQRAAERRAKSAQPHLEQARRALNLRGELQLQCDVTHTEQDNRLPMVTAEGRVLVGYAAVRRAFIRTPLGVHLLAVCGRRVGGADAPTAREIEGRLQNQNLAMLARRYLRDLRADALIELK
jgi:hypothetical protein